MIEFLSDDECICSKCMEQNFDREKIDELTNKAIEDLEELYATLQQNLEKCDDPEGREEKFQNLATKLEAIENSIVNIHDTLKDENNLTEGLDSNFGITVKIESLEAELKVEKKLHDKLLIEWYSQEEHLSKLVDKVHLQDLAVQNQSIYCTTQGFTLGKMLWKISNKIDLLEKILKNENFTRGIVQTFKNCLEAFTLTYLDSMPLPTAVEYLFVLSLAGTLSNISSVPDGRYFIINHITGEEALNEIIDSLPKIHVPVGESLKWILLTIIHNMLVCQEGEEYAKRNKKLLLHVAKCARKPNSERVTILALKILGSLTADVKDELYMSHILTSVPECALKKLKKDTTSASISKNVSCVLSSVMKINQYYRDLENEKFIRTTQLNESRSSCRVKSKASKSSKKKSKPCSCNSGKLDPTRSSVQVKSKSSVPVKEICNNCQCHSVKVSDFRSSKVELDEAKVVPSQPEPRPSKTEHKDPEPPKGGNVCCCYVTGIELYNFDNETFSSSSTSNLSQDDDAVDSVIYIKRPTTSTNTLQIDGNFNSKSSSICGCCPSLIFVSDGDHKTRFKRKLFHITATDSVNVKTAELNLTCSSQKRINQGNESELDNDSYSSEDSLSSIQLLPNKDAITSTADYEEVL